VLYCVTCYFSIKNIAKVPRKYFHLIKDGDVGWFAIQNIR
jgi:hypothetical protein